MPIRALCTICSDFFDHSRDVAAIHCGHTFHLHCLIQWFETAPSRTCPQCRIQVGRRSIINKLFFDLAQEEESVLDAEFLKRVCNHRSQPIYLMEQLETFQPDKLYGPTEVHTLGYA